MKSLLIFFFCLAIFAVEAQLKLTTAKRQVTSTNPKLTPTRKTNGTASTTITGEPVPTIAATTIPSYKVCRDKTSTATSGSIQPLPGLKPAAITGPMKTCSFSIVVPSNQQVQMSCSVAKLTSITNIFDSGYASSASSLIFDGTLDLFYVSIIVPNRVYTSHSNKMTVTYRVVNAADTFNCNWKTIQAPTTTTAFKWCRDSETTAANGSIQTLREPVGNANAYLGVIRLCPFFINSSPNRQIQTSCSFSNASPNFGLSTFRQITDEGPFKPKFSKTTAKSNQVDLLLLHRVTATDSPISCNWTTTSPTTTTSDSNKCVNVKSTTTNGTITSLANTNFLKTCLLSIFVSLGQRIQMSCMNVNIVGSTSTLTLFETAEISTRPFKNVYTSINNRLDVLSTLGKGDSFRCNWTTITIPPTTNFKVCRDGETTVASGTVTPLENTEADVFGSFCRFTITAPANERVQISCPFINKFTNISFYEFNPFISDIANPPVVKKTYTSKGNQISLNLNLNFSPFWGPPLFNCTWKFV